MQGNYRQHYLLSAAQTAVVPSRSKQQQQQQQQQQQATSANNFNGLPTPTGNSNAKLLHSQILPTNYPLLSSSKQNQRQPQSHCAGFDRPMAQGFAADQLHIDQQHQQQAHRQVRAAREYRTSNSAEIPTNNSIGSWQRSGAGNMQQLANHSSNNNIIANQMLKSNKSIQQHHFNTRDLANEHQRADEEEEGGGDDHNGDDAGAEHRRQLTNGLQYQDQYASQLRSNQLQQRFQHQNQQPQGQFLAQSSMQALGRSRPSQAADRCNNNNWDQHQVMSSTSKQHQHTTHLASTSAGNSKNGGNSSQNSTGQQQARKTSSTSASKDQVHVNFNRSSRAAGTDDEDCDGRKKKYLTAKYGQQQMNLIKKRLKIETWLYEQLQELAKGSKSEAELDEIDVDLDQLLDMDDDDTRRRWLKKTLEPFVDLPSERIDKFIDDVLEQSKLL